MIPRFSNPHSLAQSTQSISRKDLEKGDAEDPQEAQEQKRRLEDSASDVAKLDALLKRSLGDIVQWDSPLEDGGGAPAGPSERKRKKRKVDRAEVSDGTHQGDIVAAPQTSDEVVPFRLLSSARAPTLVSLQLKPPPVIEAVGPSYEDDEEEARVRSERAAAAAVDSSWIIRESQRSYPESSGNGKIIVVTTDGATFDDPAVFVAEIPRSALKSSGSSAPHSRPRLPEKTRPSPHAVNPEKFSYPLIECTTQPGPQKKKLRRKKGKIQPKERPPPAYWRALREWGGKGAGYAYGYPSSRPVMSEGTRWKPYRRDNMKKAIFVV